MDFIICQETFINNKKKPVRELHRLKESLVFGNRSLGRLKEIMIVDVFHQFAAAV